MSVDVLFAEIDRLLGSKSDNFKNPLASALATYHRTSADLSQSSTDTRAKKWFDETDNAQVVAVRERLVNAQRELEAARADKASAIEQIKAQLPQTLTDEQKKLLRAERTGARKDVEANVNGLRALAERLFDDAQFAAAINEFAKSFSGKRAGRGAGAPKARVESVHAVHPNGVDITEKSFSRVAQRTKLDAGLMAQAWYNAAGTDEWKEITEVATFPVGEWTITVTPRQNGTEVAANQPDLPVSI